ncbi:MAG: hypothetical protein QXS76_00130 [Candidatus Bathyarchaeia archaeon]
MAIDPIFIEDGRIFIFNRAEDLARFLSALRDLGVDWEEGRVEWCG